MGKNPSAEQSAERVGEQRESELNVVEFCDWIGVSPKSFYRSRQMLAANGKVLARKEHEAQRLSHMKGSISSDPELVQLTVPHFASR